MAHILILGGGFGGLIAAERLASSVGSAHEITLVSPKEHFTFYPALVQLAFGESVPDDVTFPLRSKLNELGVRFIQGEMIRVHSERQAAEIAGEDFSGDISYDYLIIATGRRLATEKVAGFFEHAHHLLGIKAAMRFGEALKEFKDGTILVGMCPEAKLPVPVCETAFALAKRFKPAIVAGNVKVKVIFPGSLSEAFGGASLHKELESAFDRHNIRVLYDIPITDIGEKHVASESGHKIDYDLLMFVPPFRGHASLASLGITDPSDFVRVDGQLRVHELKKTYAVGDIVAFSGPKLAHMAVRQAEVAAANIESELNAQQPEKEYYHEIATIIDAGGPDSIFLHYGIWDNERFSVKKGRFWGWAKEMHDNLWKARHN